MSSANPKGPLRCGWCDALESDHWKRDIIGKGVWCSISCYRAGHFRDYVFLSVCMFISILLLLPFVGVSPNGLFVMVVLFVLGCSLTIESMRAHSDRNRIPR